MQTGPLRPAVALVQRTQASARRLKPVLSAVERAAYQAAWRILTAQREVSVNDLVCPGAIRTRLVDRMAAIIAEEMARTVRR